METVDHFEHGILAEAALLWTGLNKSMFPCRDDEAVVKAFGKERVSILIVELSLLKKSFMLLMLNLQRLILKQ